MLDPGQHLPVALSAATLERFIKPILNGFDRALMGASHRRCLNVAGAAITVVSNDVDYIDQAARALATGPANSGRPCRIAVLSAQDQACLEPIWPFGQFNERELEACLARTQYRMHYMPDLNYWQIFDVVNAIGIQWTTDKGAHPPWDSGSPLRNFVQWHLGSDTTSLLHGGTLAVSGVGVLLAGEGGAGKSSTVLTGIFGGLQSVGDDYVLVDSGDLTARPVFDTLKQDEAGLRRLGQWGHPAIPKRANWQGKHQFYMPDVAQGDPVSAIALRAILLPELTHGVKTTLISTDAKTAFLALAPSGVSQIHCDRPRLFGVAGQVVRQLPAHRLCLGTDPDEIRGALQRFLEGL
jgi:hypothetical protein